MAGTKINPGTTTSIRTDTVGTDEVQVIKVALGLAGVEDTLVDSGQQVMAASVPVAIASNQSAVPVSLATAPALVAGSATIGATKDAGLNETVTRTFTQNDDISTAREITAAPTSGQKIVAVDVLVSVDTACYLTIQMETSANVLAGLYMPANGSAQVTLRGKIKGDVADKKLMMKSSVASKGACTCIYYSEA
jgi:hypothetical protein